ncbi:23 kDa integral membrane protein [Dendroctonus ponderosae]|uniref:Tetraspanin n=1 Tax=Dendroctonus ponderosae TaxID=77166 RepID=A0AAR5PSK3_DENPD|nr:23 kDa integral membrane protein [Dendroctonus ponderosae]
MASLKVKEALCLVYSGLLFISGLVLMGVAAYLLFKLFYHYTFVPSGSVGPFFVVFLLGIVHLLLTWLGVKGPTREHNFHIVLFMLFTLLLLVAEFAIGVWAIILWDEVEVGALNLMSASFEELIALNYYRKDWNKLQSQLHCCGISGVQDYNRTESYPTSCFQNADTDLAIRYPDGCKAPLIRYVKRVMIDGAILGFVCALLQAVGLFTFYSFLRALRAARAERLARRVAMQRELANAPPVGFVAPATPPVTT